MFNKQQIINEIAKSFSNNIGNRITIELANGMLQEIAKHIPEMSIENVDNPTADTSAQE